MNIIYRACCQKKLLVLIITALLVIPQKGFCSGFFDVGAGFDVASPQGKFRDNIDRNGFGFSGHGLIKPSPLIPLKFGIELGYINYGSETRREPFSYTIPDVTVKV